MARKPDFPITFVLRDPKSKTPTPIMGIVRFNNTYAKVSLKYSVLPENWESNKYCVKHKSDATNRRAINQLINDLRDFVSDLLDKIKAERIPLTKDLLKSKIESFITPPPSKKESNEPALFSFISDFIKESPTRTNPNTHKKIEYRTIQKYQTVQKVLKEFALTYSRKVDFDTIDLVFYNDFKNYLDRKSVV